MPHSPPSHTLLIQIYSAPSLTPSKPTRSKTTRGFAVVAATPDTLLFQIYNALPSRSCHTPPCYKTTQGFAVVAVTPDSLLFQIYNAGVASKCLSAEGWVERNIGLGFYKLLKKKDYV